MKLTPSQIQELYVFTRKHFVEHYDMQSELVDHLANDIEQIWTIQPNLSFEDARNSSFKKFGVFGFMDVVGARQKALSKKYWKLILGFVKDWFQLPKIIATGLIFILFYSISTSANAKISLLTILAVLCVIGTYKSIILNKKLKDSFKKNGKKWMLEEMIFKTGMGSFIAIPINFFNLINLNHLNNEMLLPNWLAFLYALVFTFFIILFYIVLEILPKKAEELLIENYPEYKMV